MSSTGTTLQNVKPKPTADTRTGLSMGARRRLQMLWRLAVIGVAIAYALYPLLFIISASFNPEGGLSTTRLIPRNPSLVNYQELFTRNFWGWMWNSVYIAAITSTLSVLISALSAYSFSRFRFAGRRQLLLTVFLVQVFPNSLTIVAIFLLLQTIGDYIPALGLSQHGGLILVYLGGALGINTWLMKGYFDTIPRDLDESAQIDGATSWEIFWRIIMPLVRPILAVVGILSFVGTYSEYLLALVLLRDTRLYTLSVGLSVFIGQDYGNRWGTFAAGALLGAIPVIAVYLILQDYIVGGLTAGSVKG